MVVILIQIHIKDINIRYLSIINFLSKPKKVQIWRCGAEDLPYHKLPNIDVAFTSPPYFSTEQYNKGGEHEEDQSWA